MFGTVIIVLVLLIVNNGFKHNESLRLVVEKEFSKAKSRNWNKIYIAVDFHDTIFKSSYNENTKLIFLPYAKETLQYLSLRSDIILIGWSSITQDIYLKNYKPIFDANEIKIQFFNCNPLEKNTAYADFSIKFYFNIVIDDKAGAIPKDWKIIKQTFENLPLLC
jgi:hypothetical protein